MTTRRQAKQDWDFERAFEACMKDERARIIDLLEQGDTPEQIINSYKQYAHDPVSVERAVVEAIVEDLESENRQK